MESNSLFESKYDNEFIGLLNEIGIRFEKFNKCDILKIKSWINLLIFINYHYISILEHLDDFG